MLEVKAPSEWPNPEENGLLAVFLAGSIDNGKACEWQRELIQKFARARDVLFLNPRRSDWNSALEPVASNPVFREQVEWELDALEAADIIVFYFDPNGLAPISLMELGLHADTMQTVYVCCPDGYHRQGNVEIVCERYDIEFCKDMDTLAHLLRSHIE